MFSRKSQHARERATEYATCKDFQQIFNEDMAGLHLLAYLLTADPEKAERCFMAGLEESIRGNPVFKQWARAWSKRVIIQNAIKTMSPAHGRNADAQAAPASAPGGDAPALVTRVMQWPAFERFVFTMAVLEGYSIRECAALLACSDHEIVATKSRVLQRLGQEGPHAAFPAGEMSWSALMARAQVA